MNVTAFFKKKNTVYGTQYEQQKHTERTVLVVDFFFKRFHTFIAFDIEYKCFSKLKQN